MRRVSRQWRRAQARERAKAQRVQLPTPAQVVSVLALVVRDVERIKDILRERGLWEEKTEAGVIVPR